MTESIEKLEQDIKILDKQIEIDKNLFAHNILNGMGNAMRRTLETPPPKRKVLIWKIKEFFYKIFKVL